jgi:trehalose/maltose transport system permease protein
MARRSKFSVYLDKAAFWAVVAFFVVYSLFPFYWAINTSLKSAAEVTGLVTYFPASLTFGNYESVLGNELFLRSIINSIFVSGTATLLSLAVGIFAAYALGRLQFRGRSAMRYIILAMNIFPTISILPSVLARINDLGLFGSLSALVITYPLFVLPVIVWTMVVFFRALPPEIEQAAFVDGATPIQTFTKVLLPLTMPVLATTGLLSFISLLNEYLFALTFTSIDPTQRTVPVALAFLSGQSATQNPVAEIMAASIVVTIPVTVVVLLLQRAIVGDTSAGAVKG